MFRFKESVKVSYVKQGYIYFTSRRYEELDESRQRKIRRLCRECGGTYSRALFAAMTTDTPTDIICEDYYISKSTLSRMVREYYERFPPTI